MINQREIPEDYLLPAGCTSRAGQLADYQQAFQMINCAGQYLNGRDDLTDPELIRLDWLSKDFSPETDIQIVFDSAGNMAGLAEVWQNNKPPVNPWIWICVHPDHFQSGIWEYLLSWSEIRSRHALEVVPEGIRVAAQTGTEHHHPAGVKIIQKLGWTYVRSFYRMMVELNEKPVVSKAPDGIQIRAFDPATEMESVYRAFEDSFRDHYNFVEQPFEDGFAKFKHNLVEEPGYDPNFWFVAVKGKEIAGISICRPVDAEDPESGWVNELGVRRQWRKKGLGLALLQHSFAAFYAIGQKRAALGVDATSLTGANLLYEKAGMRAVRQFDNFEKEYRSGKDITTKTLDEN